MIVALHIISSYQYPLEMRQNAKAPIRIYDIPTKYEKHIITIINLSKAKG